MIAGPVCPSDLAPRSLTSLGKTEDNKTHPSAGMFFGDSPRFGKAIGGHLLGECYVDVLPQTSSTVGPGTYSGRIIKPWLKRQPGFDDGASQRRRGSKSAPGSFMSATRRADSGVLASAVIKDDVLVVHKRPVTPGPGMYTRMYDRFSPWVVKSFNTRARSGNSPVRRRGSGTSAWRNSYRSQCSADPYVYTNPQSSTPLRARRSSRSDVSVGAAGRWQQPLAHTCAGTSEKCIMEEKGSRADGIGMRRAGSTGTAANGQGEGRHSLVFAAQASHHYDQARCAEHRQDSWGDDFE